MTRRRLRGGGSISLLIDSPLRDLMLAMRTLPAEQRKHVAAHTKRAAQPIWKEETAQRALTLLGQRALVDTARVNLGQRNATLISGRDYPGTSGDRVTRAAEFGGGAGKTITSRTRGGTAYRRLLGTTFGHRYRNGRTVYPAARAAIPRVVSLWVQTTRRAIHETIEKVTT